MIKFWKAHAYGNDFLYVEHTAVDGAALDVLAREMCDRHTGVGADGLIVFERTRGGAAMRLFNSDGGRAEVSGNGVRALAALLGRDETAEPLELTIATEGGAKRLTRTGRTSTHQTFRAAMGQPAGLTQQPLSAGGESLTVAVLNMGNPQAVLLGPLPDDDRFNRLGAAIERHPLFPERTNVEFAVVESPARIRIRIWERGAGPTTSSGTGSCAALVAAAQFGGAAREAEVIAPGGAQLVEWRDDGVYLTGSAEVLCAGEWLRPLPRPADAGRDV
jgi:diaminopimelate epimerase